MYKRIFNLGQRISVEMEKRSEDPPEVRLSQDPEQVKAREQAVRFMQSVLYFPDKALANRDYILNGLNNLDSVYRESSGIREEMVPFALEFSNRLEPLANDPRYRGYRRIINMIRATVGGYGKAPVPEETTDIAEMSSPIQNVALKTFPTAAWTVPMYLSHRIPEGGGLPRLFDLVKNFAKRPSWQAVTASSLRGGPSIFSTLKGFLKSLLLLDPRKKGLKALNPKDIATNSSNMGAFMYLLRNSLELGGDLVRGEKDPDKLFKNTRMRSLGRGYRSLPPSLQQYMPPTWKNFFGIPPASAPGADVSLSDRLKGLSPIVTQFDPRHPLKAGSALLRLLFNAPTEVSDFANAVTDMGGYQATSLMRDLGEGEAGVSQLPHFALRRHMKQHPEAYGPATRKDISRLERASKSQSLKSIYKDESALSRALTTLFSPGGLRRGAWAVGNAVNMQFDYPVYYRSPASYRNPPPLRPRGTTPTQWRNLIRATGYRPTAPQPLLK